MDLEAKFPAHVLHLFVLQQRIGEEAVEFLVPGDIDQTTGQLGSQAPVLPLVSNHNGELCRCGSVDFAHPAHAEDFVTTLAKASFGNQSDFAIIVVETNAEEAAVFRPPVRREATIAGRFSMDAARRWSAACALPTRSAEVPAPIGAEPMRVGPRRAAGRMSSAD